MSSVEVLSTVLARVQALRKGGLFAGIAAFVAGTALFAQGAVLPRPAAADAISDVQAQAQQLASEIASQGARIHALTEQYDQAELQEEAIAQQVRQAQDGIAQMRSEVDSSLAQLRRQAVSAYIDGTSAPGSISLILSNSPDQAALREEYLTIANGDVRDTIDNIHIEEAALRAKESQLEVAEQSAQSVVATLDADRQSLASEAAQEEATLNQVQGQLATLVAQAEEQKVAAAAAAQQQAEERQRQQQAFEAGAASQAAHPPAVESVQAPPPGGGQPTPAGLATVASPPPPQGGGGSDGNAFYEIRQCESGGNYSEDTGNGYYGAYQISPSTWASLGYSGLPSQAPPSEQDAAAAALQARSGWSQWPTCSAMLGLG